MTFDTPTIASATLTQTDQRRAAVHLVLFALILLLATALRFHDITRHCLWSDEIYTLETSAGHGLQSKRLQGMGVIETVPDLMALDSSRPWWAIATSLARDDNHPPLYFLLVRAWRHLFGDSDLALRSLSLLFSVVAIALFYDAMRRLHGVTPALWAALLMAVATPQIQFAQEGRSYALLMMLGMAACAAVVRIETEGMNRWRWLALATSLLALMLAHYYAIAPVAALAAYLIVRLRGRPRQMAIIALLAAGVLLLALWGWGIWRQRLNLAANNYYIIERPGGHGMRTLSRVAILPIRFLFEPLLRAEPAARVGVVLLILPLFLLRRRPELLLWMLWVISTVALITIVDLSKTSKQLDFMRYTVLASPAAYALIASMLAGSSIWLRHALPAAAAASCLLALPFAYEATPIPKVDWRIIAAAIQRDAQPTDVMLFYGYYPNDAGILTNQYLMLQHYAPRLPRAAIFTEQLPDEATMNRLRKSSAVWVIAAAESPLPENYLPGFKVDRRLAIFGLPRVMRWVTPK